MCWLYYESRGKCVSFFNAISYDILHYYCSLKASNLWCRAIDLAPSLYQKWDVDSFTFLTAIVKKFCRPSMTDFSMFSLSLSIAHWCVHFVIRLSIFNSDNCMTQRFIVNLITTWRFHNYKTFKGEVVTSKFGIISIGDPISNIYFR